MAMSDKLLLHGVHFGRNATAKPMPWVCGAGLPSNQLKLLQRKPFGIVVVLVCGLITNIV